MKNSKSGPTISSAKANEFFTVYSLLIKDFKTSTRKFANLWIGALIADKIADTIADKIAALVPTGLRDLLVSSDILLDATSFSKILAKFFLG